LARRLIAQILSLLLLFALPGRVLAHGFGRSQDLPLPSWLYLFAVSAVVLVSFVQISLLVGVGHALRPYPHFDLLRNRSLRAALTSRPQLLALRSLSVLLFFLVVLSGLFGRQAPEQNFAPAFVWIIWWVGLGFFTAFVGNVWPLLNPWKILFEWADGVARRLGAGLEFRKPYPAGLDVWPALALFAAFVWVELVFEGSSSPFAIALLAVLYSVFTWTGMAVFGKEVWLRRRARRTGSGAGWAAGDYRGRFDPPMRNSSTARAHWRPSRMAHTTSDWPRRTSPAANTFGAEVI
jgi:hypothetical protein